MLHRILLMRRNRAYFQVQTYCANGASITPGTIVSTWQGTSYNTGQSSTSRSRRVDLRRRRYAYVQETRRRVNPGDNVGVRVHRASRREAEAVRDIFEEYYAAVGVLIRDDAAHFDQYFENGSGVWLAAAPSDTAGTGVAACVALRPLAPEGACEVKRLYVRPPYRSAGVAAMLMDALEDYAAQHGYRCIYLDTKDDLETAIRFYRRRGYEPCERYNDNPQATVFMRREIEHTKRSR